MSKSEQAVALQARWEAEWPAALQAWSHYTQLRAPEFLHDHRQALHRGMAGQIAAIRLRDQRVMVNLPIVDKQRLQDMARAILAHEVGHHVYVPGNLTDNARMLIAIARMLTGLPKDTAHLVANLYGDLLINDRLQRRAGIDVAAVYRRLAEDQDAASLSHVWQIYARTYELLWRLDPGALVPGPLAAEAEADAALLARLVRNFAGDWLRGARRFAAVLYPYLARDHDEARGQTFLDAGLGDTRQAGAAGPDDPSSDAIPDGLTAIDPTESEDDDDFDGDILDPLGEARAAAPAAADGPPTGEGKGHPGRQHRQPFEYAEILKSLGLKLDEREVTARYYRERALPHLLPFPAARAPQTTEPLPEGYQEWDAGEPIETLDPLASAMGSPIIVPGVTTVKRVYGETPGSEPARVPMDLDIYVDSSGSMPNPAIDVSYLALCGTILALSALRAGARVQATLWSGAGQFQTTPGFVRDERRILGIVTGSICGATAFPLHVLRDTYEARQPADPPAHIVVISDDGADTILSKDERGEPGASLCRRALARARGGGTLVLNLAGRRWAAQERLEALGFVVHRVTVWEDLVAFARAFVQQTYGDKP
jgi:hypothetical protein